MAANEPSPAPSRAERARNFIYWAFLMSIAIHLIGGPLLRNFKETRADEKETHKVTITTKVKPPPTPPPPTPTPPPTPPPKTTPPPVKQTNPPPQPKLKVNVPKTNSNSSKSSSSERQYVAPKTGSQEGVPQGTVASAPPAPPAPASTAKPATPAPAPPAPTRPACANPNVDAATINKAQAEMPEMARQQGASGTTTVRVNLSATGAVTGVSVYKSAGNAALDNAALAAARQTTYSPDIRDCVKVAGSYLFVVEFQQ